MASNDRNVELRAKLAELEAELSILAADLDRLAEAGHRTADAEARLFHLRENVKIILRMLNPGPDGQRH